MGTAQAPVTDGAAAKQRGAATASPSADRAKEGSNGNSTRVAAEVVAASEAARAAAPCVPDEAVALLQVKLLAAARGVFQMSRICMGPLVVNMTTEYNYSPEQKGQILSAFAAGYALTQVAGGVLADRVGGAPLLVFGLCSSALSLLLLPLAAEAGVTQLCWLLWVMGLTQGPTYPAQLVTTAKWATGGLRSYASALGGAGSTGGSLFALGLTPVLAVRVGWRATGRGFGTLAIAFCALWLLRGRSSPDALKSAAAEDRGEKSKDHGHEGLGSSFAVLMAPSVLVIFLAHSIHNFTRYFLMAWIPTYYDEVLEVSPDSAGFQQVLPELTGLLVSLAGASVGKRMQDSGALSPVNLRRFFASIAFLGGYLGLLAASRMTVDYAVTACLCVVQGLTTLQGLGFGANYLDISKHHAGLITGVGNTVATGASFMAPVVAAWILAGKDTDELELDRWQRLFCAFASSNLVGLAIYVPFCSATAVDLREGDPEFERKVKTS